MTPMRYFTLALMLLSFSAIADEECIFDEAAQEEFTTQYLASHKDAGIDKDGTIIISREGEMIQFQRGGCEHFGIYIESTISHSYTEQEFFDKVIALVEEFGHELVDAQELRDALAANQWQIIDDIYFVQIDRVASFEMEHDGKGGIYVGFYIN